LLLGDVIVAEQADDYLYQSKAISVTEGNGFEFKLSGDPYKPMSSWVEHARNLPFAYSPELTKWCCYADELLRCCVADKQRYRLLERQLIRETPKLVTGNLASSTVVGAAAEFVEWLKARDRKYKAIEMEAAGVLAATYGQATETLIIRGISDLADDRKTEMDAISGGGLRRYAMENAVNMLLAYANLGLFPRRPAYADA
jgi:nucleoside phosphorylase